MITIRPITCVKKTLIIPADKSISHRAIIFASLCKGKTVIKPVLFSDDTLATIDCMKKLGVSIKKISKDSLEVKGQGLYLSKTRKVPLFANESGTTMRVLAGLLCAQKFPTVFKGATALNRRPMRRIIEPLTKMGANISGVIKPENQYPPLKIIPVDSLKGGSFKLAIASAQVKSALMLAGMYANKPTRIVEPFQSRDHTERMLKLFKGKVSVDKTNVTVKPIKRLVSPKKVFVPGDFSSASFFIVLGLILKNSRLCLKQVNINPSRAKLFEVLKRMGADITLRNRKRGYEPYADIIVKSSELKATVVKKEEIPAMIDEIPVLCVAASFAKGETKIWGVKELKVKETDRIESMISNLRRAGISLWSSRYVDKQSKTSDWNLTIRGTTKFKPAQFRSFNDHRTAMSMIVFSLASGFTNKIDDVHYINKSFPQFSSLIKQL